MLKATTPAKRPRRPPSTTAVIAQVQSSLQIVSQSANQPRVHEELLRAAGVRLDRAGVALLYKLRRHGDTPFRITSLAALLGVDAPTVTRKVQQLERLGYVAREPDPDDGRASLICLTASGRDAVDRVLAAHRDRLSRLLEGWDDDDLRTFGALLERFAESLRTDTEAMYGD
ncbi:MAG: MarR family transcriptional regulator [Acidobacteria bacterium]|nr:MarR family transcriptional regulator [Acidobacteriota bacterium]